MQNFNPNLERSRRVEFSTDRELQEYRARSVQGVVDGWFVKSIDYRRLADGLSVEGSVVFECAVEQAPDAGGAPVGPRGEES